VNPEPGTINAYKSFCRIPPRLYLLHITQTWGDEHSHIGALDFYPIFIPLFGRKVSGVSVQDMLLRLPFLTPETKFSEQNGVKSKIYVHKATGEFSPS
jgi:hypothetical protein